MGTTLMNGEFQGGTKELAHLGSWLLSSVSSKVLATSFWKETVLQRSSERGKKKALLPNPYPVAWNGCINTVLGSLGNSEKPGNDALLQSSGLSYGGPGGLATVAWSRHYTHPEAISKPKLGKMNLVFLLNMTAEKKEITATKRLKRTLPVVCC